MYSPKYVDYLDKMRIESAFYNPKSKPKTWVGIIPSGLGVPKKSVFMRVSGLGTFRVTVFATDEIVTLGLQLNLKIA